MHQKATGVSGFHPTVSGSIIAFDTDERWVGQDLNGDGDSDDKVIMYYDTSTDTITNTGVVGTRPSLSGSIMAFSSGESMVQRDLNCDGDEIYAVIMYLTY